MIFGSARRLQFAGVFDSGISEAGFAFDWSPAGQAVNYETRRLCNVRYGAAGKLQAGLKISFRKSPESLL